MPTAAYFRQQAKHCRDQARTVTDARTADHLVFVAEEYEAEAERMENEARAPESPD